MEITVRDGQLWTKDGQQLEGQTKQAIALMNGYENPHAMIQECKGMVLDLDANLKIEFARTRP